jgi:hypothetical protein
MVAAKKALTILNEKNNISSKKTISLPAIHSKTKEKGSSSSLTMTTKTNKSLHKSATFDPLQQDSLQSLKDEILAHQLERSSRDEGEDVLKVDVPAPTEPGPEEPVLPLEGRLIFISHIEIEMATGLQLLNTEVEEGGVYIKLSLQDWEASTSVLYDVDSSATWTFEEDESSMQVALLPEHIQRGNISVSVMLTSDALSHKMTVGTGVMPLESFGSMGRQQATSVIVELSNDEGVFCGSVTLTVLVMDVV